MKLIGLTGGIGSGKTASAQIFRHLGAGVIDADIVAKEVLKKRDVSAKLCGIFGKGILRRGEIDTKKLAETVFSDSRLLKKLTAVTHPLTITMIMKEARAFNSGIVIVDAPLLIESGLYKKMDFIIVVKTSKKTQFLRCAKKGYSQKEVARRMLRQLSLKKKLAKADFVIDNEASLDKTREQIVNIWKKLVD